ncbi:hypothetical protein DFP72DRAFT_1047361, partial [Ephemerocybe angulata]
MPPKSTKTASKKAKPAPAKAAPKKSTTVAKAVASDETGAATRSSKRGRADSVVEVEEMRSKRAKGAEALSEDKEVALPSKELEKPRELDEATKKQLNTFKFILADHTLRTMGAIMDAIAFGKTRPDTVREMLEAILEELKTRALAGKSIEKDIAAIEEVDEKYEEGEYDSDPDGYDKDVRRRPNRVQDMVGRLTKMYLKDIIKSLGTYSRGGTNKEMAAEVVGILEYKAKNKSKLVREYRIVKECMDPATAAVGTNLAWTVVTTKTVKTKTEINATATKKAAPAEPTRLAKRCRDAADSGDRIGASLTIWRPTDLSVRRLIFTPTSVAFPHSVSVRLVLVSR